MHLNETGHSQVQPELGLVKGAMATASADWARSHNVPGHKHCRTLDVRCQAKHGGVTNVQARLRTASNRLQANRPVQQIV